MDVFYTYTYGTAGWMALQALPLIAVPKVIVALLSREIREASPLEIYFSRSLGISLLSIGILCILLIGSVPLSSSLSDGVTGDSTDPKAPYAVPTLIVTMLYHAACAFYCYALWTTTGVSGFALGLVGSTVIAAVGLWCILFASSGGKISRKTGADKRTSGFPFKNKEAARRKGKNL